MSNIERQIRQAVCYIRKSREDEEAERRGEDTLLKQRELMVREVLSRYQFPYEIKEEVASGDSIRDRPVFRELLPELGVTYQAIVCKDLSRLGRGSYGDMGVVYDIIRDRRIFIITKDAVYDPRNFSDLRMIRFSLFFNREEYEMTLWRLTEGKYDGAQRGKWVAGSVPYGFRYDAKLQILIPHSDEAQVVRMIFAWYTEEGLGYSAIATRLHQLGIRTARGKERWQPEVIHRMLMNPAYKGTLAFRKTQRNKLDGRVVQRPLEEHIVVEDAFEPIVQKDVWEEVQTRLQRGRGRQPKVKANFAPSELAGLVRCGTCRKNMIRQSNVQKYRKKDGTVSIYEKEFLYCSTCGYAVKYRDCEAQLQRALARMSPIHPQRFAQELANRPAHAKGHHLVNIDTVRQQLADRLRAVEQRLVRAREFLLDGTFTKADYAAAKHQYELEVAKLQEQQRRLGEMQSQLEESAAKNPEAYDHIHTVLDVYRAMPNKRAKNKLLRGLFEGVVLQLTHKGTGKHDKTRFDLFIELHPSLS